MALPILSSWPQLPPQTRVYGPEFSLGPVNLTPSTLTVKSNISEESRIFVSIQHDMSTIDRPDTLMYNLSLNSNEAVEDSLIPLPLDEARSTNFSTKFNPDNYYNISVTADTCAGGSGNVESKTFVLLGQLINLVFTC